MQAKLEHPDVNDDSANGNDVRSAAEKEGPGRQVTRRAAAGAGAAAGRRGSIGSLASGLVSSLANRFNASPVQEGDEELEA